MTDSRSRPPEPTAQDDALQLLQTHFCEVLFRGHPSREKVEGERFPANIAALHGSPARREWLVVGKEWIWAVAAGVSGPTADENGIDARRVAFSPVMAAVIRAAAKQLPMLGADPGE
jgi:hypothetical protein